MVTSFPLTRDAMAAFSVPGPERTLTPAGALMTVAAPSFRLPPVGVGLVGVVGVAGALPPFTRTMQTAFWSPSVTRMFTVPLAAAVTVPLSLTVAMASFSLSQV